MKLSFTKMQGTGSDFIVLDTIKTPLKLSAAIYQRLAKRRAGVGADQILVISSASSEDVDFNYSIFDATGKEVELCGNAARCLLKYVHDEGFTDKPSINVRTISGDIGVSFSRTGITVNMPPPVFELDHIPFKPTKVVQKTRGAWQLWALPTIQNPKSLDSVYKDTVVECAVVGVARPHAITKVSDVTHAPVKELGRLLESHPTFPERANVGFMEVVDRSHIKLRTYERNVGETLCCSMAACAAVVSGICLDWLDEEVTVETYGGDLKVKWSGVSQGLNEPIWLTGTAETIFKGEIEL